MNDQILSGSCLCGAINYLVRSPFLRFAHCHCSRCRKATGTGHASNLYVASGHFAWVSGQEHIVRFDLPSAQSFATTFCGCCGSPLPHHTRCGQEVVIPAGSLDDSPTMQPQIHIFYASRVPWSCSPGGLPQSAELPEGWR